MGLLYQMSKKRRPCSFSFCKQYMVNGFFCIRTLILYKDKKAKKEKHR